MRKLLGSAMAEQETVILEIMPVLRRTLGDRLSLPPTRIISAPLAGASPRRQRLCQSGRDCPVSADVSGHALVEKVVEYQEVRKRGYAVPSRHGTFRYCPEAGQSSFGLGAADYLRPSEILKLERRDARTRPGYRNTAKTSTSGKDET